MSDEPDPKTKADVLDLVIGFVMEHEKRMDLLVERMERITEKMSKNGYRASNTPALREPTNRKPTVLTLTIDGPEDYERVRSIKIEWEKGEE